MVYLPPFPLHFLGKLFLYLLLLPISLSLLFVQRKSDYHSKITFQHILFKCYLFQKKNHFLTWFFIATLNYNQFKKKLVTIMLHFFTLVQPPNSIQVGSLPTAINQYTQRIPNYRIWFWFLVAWGIWNSFFLCFWYSTCTGERKTRHSINSTLTHTKENMKGFFLKRDSQHFFPPSLGLTKVLIVFTAAIAFLNKNNGEKRLV